MYWKNKWIAYFCSFPFFWWAMWAIRSGCSEEMSDRERITQVAHQKWANEWITHFFEQIAHSLIFGQKNEQLTRKSNEQIPSPEFFFRYE